MSTTTTTPEFDLEVQQLLAVKGIKTKLPSAQHLLAIIEAISGEIIEQKSVPWYEMRFGTIGASEIGHLIHADNKYDNGFYKIPLDRYAPAPFDLAGNFNCDYGNFFEEVTRLVFEEVNDVQVLETGSIEGFCPNQRFSPDGLAVDHDGTPIICEFKTPPKRNFVPGYISDVYYEQVLAGLLTLYAKYKIKAKGMFMDNFMKNCYLDQLRPGDRSANFDQTRVHPGGNYKTFGGVKAPYMGVVEIIPKDKDAFVNFLINSDNDIVLKKQAIIDAGEDDDISEDAGPKGYSGSSGSSGSGGLDRLEDINEDNDPLPSGDESLIDSLFSKLEEDVGEFKNDYISELGVVHRRKAFEGVVDPQKTSQFCDILRHFYIVKGERDEIKRQILFGGNAAKLEKQLEDHQDFTFVYHPLGFINPTKPGFYIGYKVFRINPITIELDYSTLRADIKLRSERVAHTRKILDTINMFVAECKQENCKPIFERKVMKAWFKKTAGRGVNDPCAIDLNVLEDALFNNELCSVERL